MARTNKRINQDKKEEKEIRTRKLKNRDRKRTRRGVHDAIRNGNWEELQDME